MDYRFAIDTKKSMETPLVAAAGKRMPRAVNYNRLGRGVPEIYNTYNNVCSCRRDKTIVFCRACGYYCNGRIRLQCAVHPRVTFLLDITECPRCHSGNFLDEHN